MDIISNICKVSWFKFYAILTNYRSPQSFFATTTLAFSIYGTIWTIAESLGISGSEKTAIVMLFSLLFIILFILLISLLRWPLLCIAVRDYIKNCMGGFSFDDYCLVSCGPGGAFGIGIVSKALQSMNRKVPKSIVVDCEYTKKGEPDVASLIVDRIDLDEKKCLIVHTYLGTGGSLRALRKALNLPNAPVFCFVMSEALDKRDPAEYCLFVGNRSVLPWPQSETQK